MKFTIIPKGGQNFNLGGHKIKIEVGAYPFRDLNLDSPKPPMNPEWEERGFMEDDLDIKALNFYKFRYFDDLE